MSWHHEHFRVPITMLEQLTKWTKIATEKHTSRSSTATVTWVTAHILNDCPVTAALAILKVLRKITLAYCAPFLSFTNSTSRVMSPSWELARVLRKTTPIYARTHTYIKDNPQYSQWVPSARHLYAPKPVVKRWLATKLWTMENKVKNHSSLSQACELGYYHIRARRWSGLNDTVAHKAPPHIVAAAHGGVQVQVLWWWEQPHGWGRQRERLCEDRSQIKRKSTLLFHARVNCRRKTHDRCWHMKKRFSLSSEGMYMLLCVGSNYTHWASQSAVEIFTLNRTWFRGFDSPCHYCWFAHLWHKINKEVHTWKYATHALDKGSKTLLVRWDLV